nr:hypothetical protein [uncultured Pedobacter sp.]
MQTILKTKLHTYICESNPELVVHLEETFSLNNYLEEKIANIGTFLQNLIESGKPSYVIKELCMNRLTEDLKPSKFMYLKALLEEEFTGDYLMMQESGTLTFETINIIQETEHLFHEFPFNREREDNSMLRSALTAFINDYLKQN